PRTPDLPTGRGQAGIDALPNALPHIRAGGLRALAVLPTARSAALPDVPTMAETIPGFEVSTWSGVGVPAGTPPAIVARLSREIAAGLADAGLAARFAEVGAVPLRLSSEEMRAAIAGDVAKWGRVVKTAGIAAE